MSQRNLYQVCFIDGKRQLSQRAFIRRELNKQMIILLLPTNSPYLRYKFFPAILKDTKNEIKHISDIIFYITMFFIKIAFFQFAQFQKFSCIIQLLMGGCYTGEGKNKNRRICCFKNGSTYVGDMQNEEPHGRGAFYYPDGDIIFGHWKDGVLTGQIPVKQCKDGIALVGIKNEGRFQGQFKSYFSDGAQYIIKMNSQVFVTVQKINNQPKEFSSLQEDIDLSQKSVLIKQNEPSIKLEGSNSIIPAKQIKGMDKIFSLNSEISREGFQAFFKFMTPSQIYKGLLKPYSVRYSEKSLPQKTENVRLKILRKVRDHPHKNIIQIEELEERQKCLVREFFSGTLYEMIPKLNDKFYVLFHMRELAKGLDHLHKVICFHRYINPNNIIMTFKKLEILQLITLKYCNFGLLQIAEVAPSLGNAFNYHSPQVIKAIQSKDIQNVDYQKADIWSLAIVYIEMMGASFLSEKESEEIRDASRKNKGKLRDLVSKNIKRQYRSDRMLDMMCSLLEFEPENRTPAEQLAEMLMDLPQFTNEKEKTIKKSIKEMYSRIKADQRGNYNKKHLLLNIQSLEEIRPNNYTFDSPQIQEVALWQKLYYGQYILTIQLRTQVKVQQSVNYLQKKKQPFLQLAGNGKIHSAQFSSNLECYFCLILGVLIKKLRMQKPIKIEQIIFKAQSQQCSNLRVTLLPIQRQLIKYSEQNLRHRRRKGASIQDVILYLGSMQTKYKDRVLQKQIQKYTYSETVQRMRNLGVNLQRLRVTTIEIQMQQYENSEQIRSNLVEQFGKIISRFQILNGFRFQFQHDLDNSKFYQNLVNSLNSLESLSKVRLVILGNYQVKEPNWAQNLNEKIKCTIQKSQIKQ